MRSIDIGRIYFSSMALFEASAEWDTDPATDKLCDMLLSQHHNPKMKKTKHMKKKMMEGTLGETVLAKVKDEDMRHTQRYQKNRKKKQIMLKKAMNQDDDQTDIKEKKFKKEEDVLSKSTEKKPKKSKKDSAKSPEPSTKKKPKKSKKDSAKNEEPVASVLKKNSKNKYKYLAGKGKRMDTLTIAPDEPEVVTNTTPSPTKNMDIDSDLKEESVKIGQKRKLNHADESPKKKKLKKEIQMEVVDHSDASPKKKKFKKETPVEIAKTNGDTEVPQCSENKPVVSSNGHEQDDAEKKTKNKKKKNKPSPKAELMEVDNDNESEQIVKNETSGGSKPSVPKKKGKALNENGNTGIKSHDGSTALPANSTKLTQLKSPKQIEKIRSLLAAKEAKPAESTKPTKPIAPQVQAPKKQAVKKGPLSLKERMEEQLKASRFRYLNEQLYTSDSKSAQELFEEDPEAFEVYHHGYQAQVSKWPANPVDRVISYVKARDKKLVIVDFGCGDAKLAQSVPNKVHSFDLVAVNKHVKVADSADVPLPDKSVDIAVFSLSLMGTNFVDFLIEANRVLKQRGTLLIAEVVSRFEKVVKFTKKLEKLGFKLIDMDKSNKMFIWFELSKEKTVTQDADIPDIELLPCIYKKR